MANELKRVDAKHGKGTPLSQQETKKRYGRGFLVWGAAFFLFPLQAPAQQFHLKPFWDLDKEDFAHFEVKRRIWRYIPKKGGEGFREREEHFAVNVPCHGVFGFEVNDTPGYFQPYSLNMIPFSIGTSFSSGGRKKQRFYFLDVFDYKRVFAQGKWEDVSRNRYALVQKGIFMLSHPKGKIRINKVLSRFSPPPRSLQGMRVEIERKIDLKKKVVSFIKARMQGHTWPWGNPFEKVPFHVEDTYSFDRIYRYRYKGFRKDVDKAIEGGVKEIRWNFKAFNKFVPVDPNNKRDYKTGIVALSLLTLLKAEANKEDPLLKKCMDYLRSEPVLNTYSLGVSLMAFEAYYAPYGERDELVSGAISRPYPRKPSQRDRRTMEQWTKRLVSYIDPRVDSAYEARWRYIGEKDFDNSNSQYAVLGLYSAYLCGIKFPVHLFRSAAVHYIKCQERRGPRVPVPPLVTHVEFKRLGREKSLKERRTTSVAQARGFPYVLGDRATGSMTTAGIGVLSIASSFVPKKKRRGKQWVELRQALDSADAWLYHHFSVRENPGFGNSWYFYYLYGLERAMELRCVALFGKRDWYWEGAVHLLLSRKSVHGGWPGLENTCFAVLFLKKAQTPVITGK